LARWRCPPPRTRGGHPGDDKELRVERLVYEGMSKRLARAEVYGREEVLKVGN
jgi:hypothetical protein